MISLTKKDFISLLTAYQEEKLLLDKVADFIEGFASSYIVLDETPTGRELLKYVAEKMEDSNDYIGWYLFEKDENMKVCIDEMPIYLEDLSDLYDLLSIANPDEEDIAYYIAENILEDYRDKFAEEIGKSDMNNMDIYIYICRNVDKAIEKFAGSLNKKEANMYAYLNILKDNLKGIDREEMLSPLDKENVGREEIRQYLKEKLEAVNCRRVKEVTDEMINKVIEMVMKGDDVKTAADKMLGCIDK